MARLRIFAIGIDEVHDLLGATAPLAGRLRAVAAERFVPANELARPRGTLLGRIGPLFKHPIDPPEPPAGPGPLDVETLIAGRSVDPDRLVQAWQLMDAWLEDLAWGTLSPETTPAQLSSIDFAIARTGVAGGYGIGRLFARDPQLGLRPAPGMRVGYSPYDYVIRTREALVAALPGLDAESRPAVEGLAEFLGAFGSWRAQAAQTGRPEPDLFVIFWP